MPRIQMKYGALLGLLILQSSFLGANGSHARTLIDLTFTQGYAPDPGRVFIPFNLTGRLITVECRIDSLQGNFILDTGSKNLLLNQKYFTADQTATKTGVGIAGDVGQIGETVIDTMYWDNLTLLNVESDVLSLEYMETKKKARILGVLGFSLLRDFEIFIDFQFNQLILTRITNEDDDLGSFELPYDSVSFDLVGHLPVLKVTVNDATLLMGLDTGAEFNLLDRRVKRKARKNFDILKRMKLGGIGAAETEVFAGVLREVKLEDLPSMNMRTILTDISLFKQSVNGSIDGLIGYEFLYNKRVLLAYHKRKLYFFKPLRS